MLKDKAVKTSFNVKKKIANIFSYFSLLFSQFIGFIRGKVNKSAGFVFNKKYCESKTK